MKHLIGALQQALVAFLNALTGDNIKALVADAYAVPIGDPQ
jgi:hypothetical protein